MTIPLGSRAVGVLWVLLILVLAVGLSDRSRPDGLGLGVSAIAAELGSDAAMASEADRHYQEARRAKRVERLWIVAAAVYVPPLVLLVFGWAIAGIVRRFRTASPH